MKSYLDRLEHPNMEKMRQLHPEWIWNRSDTHIFLSPPEAPEAFKTPVEPGNAFAPGPMTFGISTWVYSDGRLYAPEQMLLDELKWHFLEKGVPVLVCEWQAGPLSVRSSLFSNGEVSLLEVKDYLTVQISNPTSQNATGSLFIPVRSFGAGGSPLYRMTYSSGVLSLNGKPLVYCQEAPSGFGALSYAETKQDISVCLLKGQMPDQLEVDDPSGWASGAFEYIVDLAPGASFEIHLMFYLHYQADNLTWLKAPDLPLYIETEQTNFVKNWRQTYPARLQLPDRRFEEAFYAQLNHMYMATVLNGPRTTPVTYPRWWMRDGSYQIVALDKAGLHDFAGRACFQAARKDYYTGFGSEADAPGEFIWIASEHYLLTRSVPFLKEIYPYIREKAELIIHMRHAEKPLVFNAEFITHEHAFRADTQVCCAPARDGLVIGRMDFHYPLMFVNGFCYLGLSRAACCAREMGLEDEAQHYQSEASSLREAILKVAPNVFATNERDTFCALTPHGWADRDDPVIRQKYQQYWLEKWCVEGVMHHEPLWTYFEVGDAHNRMLLGERQQMWAILDYYLKVHTAPGLYTYPEGDRDENSSLLMWEKCRGWDRAQTTTPAGWTAAELFLLLRDALAREDGEALVLGSGIPMEWMAQAFSINCLPTYFGLLSYHYDPAGEKVEVKVKRMPLGGIRADFPVACQIVTS